MVALASAGVADPLEQASDFVRSYTGMSFNLVTDDVVKLDPRPDGSAALPEMPVTAVTQIRAYLPDPINGGWTWQTLDQWGWTKRGLVYSTANQYPPITQNPSTLMYHWPWLPESLEVTYTHGWATIPQDIQDVVQRMAQQISTNPLGLQSRRVGEVNVVYGTNGQMSIAQLKPNDKLILDRYALQEVE